jgi:hypothetical protein
MNTWIDFCIIVDEENLQKAGIIIQKAYDEWWKLSDIQEPIADWICKNLNESGIIYEIYFKSEEEEEE